MLLRGSNTRARGQSPNRSRGSTRGRGSASRGASNSSGTSPTENSPNPFELERLENAAKREQRGQNGTAVNGRGGRGTQRGTFSSKQVRFADPLAADKKDGRPRKSPSPAPANPFVSTSTSSPFGTPATTSLNPFAPAKTEPPNNPFRTPSPASNPFGAPSQLFQPPNTTNIFDKPSGASTQESSQNSSLAVFGAPSNPFGAPPQTNGIFNSASTSKPSSTPLNTNPFGVPSGAQPPPFSTTPVGSPAVTFGSPSLSNTAATSNPTSRPPNASPFRAPSNSGPAFSTTPFGTPTNTFGSPPPGLASTASTSASRPLQPTMNAFGSTSQPAARNHAMSATPSTAASASSSALAKKMDQHLREEGLVPPAWPTSTPGDPKQKGVVEGFWQTSKGYRSKVRASLIRAGFLDDPDKPKKLSDAIDFKGTCEDMCPEFERITRIVEHDVQGAEKDVAPDGSLWPAPQKMVKALARSAAGQDAPLPMDVRSPAALRRTFDYLLHTVLGEEGELPTVHGFLWDRTRAIRRDFVFQSSMSPTELSDQVYCLERITRFHVIALHQMSREEVVAEDFSEQQEVEQLGKALLSLIHAYEDCQAQGIPCENEAEFRAYYVLFNSHNSGILETVQDWGWKFWGESDQVRTAVSLVETLQNIWDTRGPLKPHSATDIAQNGYSRFFSIIAEKKVSYTMACFAEIHFNSVRKSALKTILASYRKQRDQTKDWTLTKLNAYLRFDEEEDIIEFGEAYSVQFEEADGETYLSLASDDVSDPFPPLKQRHSYSLVERKRGDHSLPAVIDATVYDEGEVADQGSDDEYLFVSDRRSETSKAPALPSPKIAVHEDAEETLSTPTFQNQPMPEKGAFQKSSSIFAASKPFTADFFTPKPAEPTAPAQPKPSQDAVSIFSKPPGQEASSIFAKTSQNQPVKQAPSFSFLNQPFMQPTTGGTQSPLSIEQHTVTSSPPPAESSKPIFFGPSASASPPVESPRPMFRLGQHPVTASPPTNQTPTPPFSPGQHSLNATPPSQRPIPQFSLGGHSASTPRQPSVGDAPEPPRLASPLSQAKQSPSSQPPFSTGATCSHIQNPVFSGSPQASVQQSQSSPAQKFQDQNGRGMSSFTPTKPPVLNNRKLRLDNLAKWVTMGDGGLVDQFIEHQVEEIVRGAVGIFLREKAERIAKEEDDRAKEQADQFRYRSLATKYGHKWREAAHRLWVRRRGREARKARQEMAESLRASKALQSANIVEDFRASTSGSRRGSLESLLDATGVLNGVHDSNSEIRVIVQREVLKPPSKRRRMSDRSPESPASSTNGHKRGRSDNPLRRSLLSDPSYLQGGSRIHLMSKYDVKDETRRQVSGVQTDYFRLKARGIATLPNGTPLANSAAKDILHQKRSFDGITKPTTPKSLMPPPATRSVPAKPMMRPEGSRNSTGRNEDLQAMKARAKARMAENQECRQKKRTFDDEDELFARAKRVREQMDEGMEWYRKEIEASRSAS